MTGYHSPYGKPRGLARRLAEWSARLGADRNLPWMGLGIIEDLRMAAQILNKTEWLESMRLSSDPEAQRFASELLGDDEEHEATVYAAERVEGLPDEPHALPPVETIEKLDARAVDYGRVRDVLVETGALADDDTQTPVADLLRALLS